MRSKIQIAGECMLVSSELAYFCLSPKHICMNRFICPRSFLRCVPVWFLIVCLAACSSADLPTEEASLILEKAIKAHGGTLRWENFRAFHLQKETWLYTETGELEAHTLQNQRFVLRPSFAAEITSSTEQGEEQVLFENGRTTYWVADRPIFEEDIVARKEREVFAAFYVLTKPFDLVAAGKHRWYEGQTLLPNGQTVETVRIIDGDTTHSHTDVWWYYFTPEAHRLVAYKVRTSGHFSLVYNEAWDESTGVLFPTQRSSYRVDSLGTILYLRARYEFRNIAAERPNALPYSSARPSSFPSALSSPCWSCLRLILNISVNSYRAASLVGPP